MSSIGLYFCAASIGMVFVSVGSEMVHCFFRKKFKALLKLCLRQPGTCHALQGKVLGHV